MKGYNYMNIYVWVVAAILQGPDHKLVYKRDLMNGKESYSACENIRASRTIDIAKRARENAMRLVGTYCTRVDASRS